MIQSLVNFEGLEDLACEAKFHSFSHGLVVSLNTGTSI